MIQVVDLFVDHPLVEARSVSPSSTSWWRCAWKLCWTQLGLLPCADVSFVFRKVRVPDENDKGLLGSRPVALRPDEVRRPGPDLDQIQRPLQVYVWNHEAYQDGTNVSGWCKWRGQYAVGNWGWGWGRRFEDWGRCLEVKVRNGLEVWLHLIENWSLINRMIRPSIVR